MGGTVFDLPLAADISLAAGCAVLLPDYRLAPEHRFPAGLEDCISAHDWMIGNGPSGPRPAMATFIAGDSAGGNLTLAALLALRDRKRKLPAGGIALSAATGFALASDSLKTVPDPIISARTIPGFRDRYPESADPRDPLASPVFGDYEGIPPLLIQVGEVAESSRRANRHVCAGMHNRLRQFRCQRIYHRFLVCSQYRRPDQVEHQAELCLAQFLQTPCLDDFYAED